MSLVFPYHWSLSHLVIHHISLSHHIFYYNILWNKIECEVACAEFDLITDEESGWRGGTSCELLIKHMHDGCTDWPLLEAQQCYGVYRNLDRFGSTELQDNCTLLGYIYQEIFSVCFFFLFVFYMVSSHWFRFHFWAAAARQKGDERNSLSTVIIGTASLLESITN